MYVQQRDDWNEANFLKISNESREAENFRASALDSTTVKIEADAFNETLIVPRQFMTFQPNSATLS